MENIKQKTSTAHPSYTKMDDMLGAVTHSKVIHGWEFKEMNDEIRLSL